MSAVAALLKMAVEAGSALPKGRVVSTMFVSKIWGGACILELAEDSA